jgi:hypothetical protein
MKLLRTHPTLDPYTNEPQTAPRVDAHGGLVAIGVDSPGRDDGIDLLAFVNSLQKKKTILV